MNSYFQPIYFPVKRNPGINLVSPWTDVLLKSLSLLIFEASFPFNLKKHPMGTRPALGYR
jgi:hypothetical protein